MKLRIERWEETRRGMSGGTLSSDGGRETSPNLTSVKLFRGYVVKGERKPVRFDREGYPSYKACHDAAQAYVRRQADETEPG